MFQTSESCIKLHAVVVLEHFLSEHCSRCVCVCVCVYLDGSNAENNISLLVILCIIMYVKKIIQKNKIKSKPIFFFYKTDYGKMLKYREKYR